MRLYPPAWLMGRTALEDVEIGGYLLPKTVVFLYPPTPFIACLPIFLSPTL